MKKIYALLAASVLGCAAVAQTPSLLLTTENYENAGSDNVCTIGLGAVKAGTVMVDCGFGKKAYEVTPATYDPSTQTIVSTYIECSVSATGRISVYCPDSVQIDYLNAEGCGITSFETAHPEWFEVINLRHNSLKRADFSAFANLSSIDVGDNPFDNGLVIGPNKPNLTIINIDITDNLEPSFSPSNYPALMSFDSFSNPSLRFCDTSGCPNLKKLSIDNTNVQSIDISANPELLILNVSDTGVDHLDLSTAPKLRELYCTHQSGVYNTGTKLTSLDVTCCPELVYLFASGNKLTSLDLSKNTKLQDIYLTENYLTSLDVSHNPNLYNVVITYNCMDFATLPVDPGTWGTYEYKQRPLPVPQSILAGTSIDLSSKVNRDGSETIGVLYSVSEDSPNDLEEVDDDAYTYANGIITFHKVIADSVLLELSNTLFPMYPLTSNRFKVKGPDTFGKPDLAITFTVPELDVNANLQFRLGIAGACAQTPKKYYVDFGDGVQVEQTTTSQSMPAALTTNRKKQTYGQVKIYVPEGEKVTAFGIKDVYISDIDLSANASLLELEMIGTGLYSIDLGWNRCLTSLNLQGNNLTNGLTLAGANDAYNKNVLSNIVLKNNQLSKLTLNPRGAIKHLDISGNKFTEYDFSSCDNIESLDVSNNLFGYLKINYLGVLRTLNISHNNIAEMVLPETNVIEDFDLTYNCFKLNTMPDRNGLDDQHYRYAPQAAIPIPTKGPGFDLTDQWITIDGNPTVFTLKTSTGATLTQGTDYTNTAGRIRLLDPTIGKSVYTEITNAAFPAFSGANILKTTQLLSAGNPQNVIGSFTTTMGGQTVELSLAAAVAGDAIYIDWKGDGDIEQYQMDTNYKLFSAKTTANTQVKVYSYDANSSLSVFSMGGAYLKDVDLSGMTNLITLAVRNANISSMAWPASPALIELFLDNNKFDNFDFSIFPNVRYVSFLNNKFKTADLRGLDKLEIISFDGNGLDSIALGGNTSLWALYLSQNNLTSIDLSQCKAMHQVYLSGNKFEHINLDALTSLRSLYLDNNLFTFATLPLPREQWTLYTYGNQAPVEPVLDGDKIDLSSQYMVADSITTYAWFDGVPVYDAELGGFVGNLLTEGEDYTVENGVTSFLHSYSDAMCMMFNPIFPNAFMYTDLMGVMGSVSDATADRDAIITASGCTVTAIAAPGTHVALYSTTGALIATAKCDSAGRAVLTAPAGVVIAQAGSYTAKFLLH